MLGIWAGKQEANEEQEANWIGRQARGVNEGGFSGFKF
jgi:hypothetical protein